MIPPLQSLVKYDTAVQVSTAQVKKKGAKKVSEAVWGISRLRALARWLLLIAARARRWLNSWHEHSGVDKCLMQ